MTGLKGFNFVATLIFEFQNIKMTVKQNIAHFILTQKQKQLLMKVILVMYLNQSIVQNIQKSLEKD